MMETIYVMILFLCYMVLWKAKKRSQLLATGIDPEVFAQSRSSLQRLIYIAMNILIAVIAPLIAAHAAGLELLSFFSRFEPLDAAVFDHAGFAAGLAGLSLCLYAQRKMGNSWRVGIDEKRATDLVTDGLYAYIRNPTYLGLYVLMAGVWLIWPTLLMALFSFTFYLLLEVQVRSEEDFLEKVHGIRYLDYRSSTKRYIPFLY